MKFITAEQAALLIQDNWTLTVGGFGHCGAPEALLAALERRFLNHGSPVSLSLLFAAGVGDRGQQGVNRLAHQGLLSSIIGGFWSLAPRLGDMVRQEQIVAHNWPQGVVSHMFRAIAGGLPGVITSTGLGTFTDPSLGGGRLNQKTVEPLVDLIDIAGSDYLLYRAPRLHCALLRGTSCDANGNVSMEREANFQDVLAQAQAVRNCGGTVIVQVQNVVENGTLAPHSVKIPGILVDYVVIAQSQLHRQTYGEQYNAAYCNAATQPLLPIVTMAQGTKKIIARRAALELLKRVQARAFERPLVVNLGIGTPEGIAAVLQAETLGDAGFVLSVESGAVGGYPAGGDSFGATSNPQAILNQAELFDFYNGGGIDLAFLGFGEIDSQCRINVSGLGNRINGVGGFINISQAARSLVFCGTFTAGGLVVSCSADGLQIEQEGSIKKLVKRVRQICYDPQGTARCTDPLLITERAVLRIHKRHLELIELAPGCTVERDILPHIDMPVVISKTLANMPWTAFNNEPLSAPVASLDIRLRQANG
ncbi:acyl CoA:acetate/3-ketoacid CoA transferase [Pseudomonas sp. nanlin1]|uniref:acyl CoA:acetate/3-ketoacid CoA transferase n=1 Tax=Pseudomonas sp. nanlin1 TaxID=3040605 RepID=UPI00388F809B